jgi:hypothetical protein
MIQVLNAISGGERFSSEGLDTVIEHGSHLPGFCLDKTGKLRASKAEISGHIEAESGTFHGKVEAESGAFGPMYLSDETQEPRVFSFPAGTSAEVVRVNIYSTFSSEEIYVNDGTYNGKSGLRRIQRDYDMSGGTLYTELILTFSDGSKISDIRRLATELTFTTGVSGRTVMLTGIPSSPSAKGMIYRDTQGYLRVST